MKEIDLAVIGDLGFNKDITLFGTKVSVGGSAYYSAVAASKFSNNVGVVAKVGSDFDLVPLISRGIETSGVKVTTDGTTPLFTMYQHPDGTRSFKSIRGVAEIPEPEIFPDLYLSAKFIHLSTSLPQHQLVWIEVLNSKKRPETVISSDPFEEFSREYPEETLLVLKSSGLVFLNEEEHLTLLRHFGEISFSVPVVLKKGPKGIIYIDKDKIITVPAPKVDAKDTTGAGDVLAGAFLALLSKGATIERALEEAVKIASKSVAEFGVEDI